MVVKTRIDPIRTFKRASPNLTTPRLKSSGKGTVSKISMMNAGGNKQKVTVDHIVTMNSRVTVILDFSIPNFNGRLPRNISPTSYFNRMNQLVKSILSPGISTGFTIALNLVLFLLMTVIGCMIYSGLDDSIHLYVLLFLAVGLSVSINWFIYTLRKVLHLEKKDT